MKTIITVENGKVTVQVDDQVPVEVEGPANDDVAKSLAKGILKISEDPSTQNRVVPERVPSNPEALTDLKKAFKDATENTSVAVPDNARSTSDLLFDASFSELSNGLKRDLPALPPVPKPATVVTKRTVLPPATALGAGCGFCIRRGTPCVRHGGERAGYVKKKNREVREADPINDSDMKDFPVGDTEWCLKCHAFTDHSEKDHPDTFETPKPVQAVAPSKPLQVEDKRPPVKPFNDTGKFLDPWDCGNCREMGRLCPTHKFMTDSGQKPPLSRQA